MSRYIDPKGQAHEAMDLGGHGHHDGAIYFYRFTRAEFAELLGGPFKVERISARLVYVLLARARKREGDSLFSSQSPSIEHVGARAAASAGRERLH